MKSTFAKIVDISIGAILIFFALTAIFSYFFPLDTAFFSAGAATLTAFLIRGLVTKNKLGASALSAAANAMFYDFLFLRDDEPARLLAAGLKDKGVNAKVHGTGLYANATAAYFFFDDPTEKQLARLFSRATRYGAKKITVFTKTPVAPIVSDMKMTVVSGDDVYKLFASLGALPARAAKPPKKRREILKLALDKKKISRYILLSLSFFAVSYVSRSIITFVCACIAAALAVASAAYGIISSKIGT